MLRALAAYFIAFGAGAVCLGLEIVGSRVLAPYFGNSIYVWGSLIAVFLLALSLGYWLGGSLADRLPTFRALALILLGAAGLILPLPLVHLPVSRFIAGLDLELRLSVLLASAAFFLLPSVLLGMVSPYVIKLRASSLDLIGRTAGRIYAVSTLGSIAGALLVSFYLIPLIGTRMILTWAGGVLLLISLLSLLAHRLERG